MSKFTISRRWHWPLFLALAAAMLASGQDDKQHQSSQAQPVGLEAQDAPAAAVPSEPLTHPRGAVGMVMSEDQMVYSVATIGPDGKVQVECITGKKNAEEKVLADSRKELSDER